MADETAREELDALLRTFSADHLKFVAVRMTTKNDKEAAQMIGFSPQTVYHWPNKRDIDRAVMLARLDSVQVAREKLRRLACEAVDVIEDEMKAGRGKGRRFDAAIAIIDRMLGNASESRNLNLDLAQLTAEQLGRIANGEDPIRVLATSGASGTEAPGTAEGATE